VGVTFIDTFDTFWKQSLFYIKNHISVKLREDLLLNTVEVIWLQVHLPHLKPIIVGSCYRPPTANSQYLDNMCEMLEKVCDINTM
jgi:hypothetical protein